VSALERIRGGLVASIQLPKNVQLGEPDTIAALARAAAENGAAGLRIESAANVRAVRLRVAVPVIGIVKREYVGFEPYITPALREVEELLAAGAQIVAFDATRRPRPDGAATGRVVAAIHDGGALAMADCAVADDGERAIEAGADAVATTLCGYTAQTRGAALPALQLVQALATFGGFTICEGGISSPRQGAAAITAGADAIVVGNAITAGLDVATAELTVARRTRAFAAALARRREGSEAS
jgi:N-acylglucosamine-6-phosphate 2-epimerase